MKGCCPGGVFYMCGWAIRWSTSKDKVATISVIIPPFFPVWHERLALQSPFRWSFGNKVSGNYFCWLLFAWKKVLHPKNCLSKDDGYVQKHTSRSCRPFWGPRVAILDFWGSQQGNFQIKNLFSNRRSKCPIPEDWTSFQSILGPHIVAILYLTGSFSPLFLLSPPRPPP